MRRRYEELRRDFRIEVPEYFNFGFDVIDQLAVERRNRLAMIQVGEDLGVRAITFRDLSTGSNRVANILRRLGIGKGDTVLIMLPRIPEWWIAMLGIMKRGAVSVPSPISLSSDDLCYRCVKGGVQAVITAGANAGMFEEIREAIPGVEHFILADGERDGWIDLRAEMDASSRVLTHFGFDEMTLASDPMLIYFTPAPPSVSPSSSALMVMHRHSYALARGVTTELWQDLKPNDIHLTITGADPAAIPSDDFFGQWLAGATLLVRDYTAPLAALDILRLLERHGVTTFSAPPEIYRMLALEDMKRFDLSELRHCVSTRALLDPRVPQVWKDGTEGLEIYEGYGRPETVTIVATLPGMKIKHGSPGKPLPPYEVEVLRADLTPAPPGEEGNLAIKIAPGHPPGIFDGYIDADDINSDIFTGDWYLTGTRARRDEEGYLVLVSSQWLVAKEI